jgi:hypothetical protein
MIVFVLASGVAYMQSRPLGSSSRMTTCLVAEALAVAAIGNFCAYVLLSAYSGTIEQTVIGEMLRRGGISATYETVELSASTVIDLVVRYAPIIVLAVLSLALWVRNPGSN